MDTGGVTVDVSKDEHLIHVKLTGMPAPDAIVDMLEHLHAWRQGKALRAARLAVFVANTAMYGSIGCSRAWPTPRGTCACSTIARTRWSGWTAPDG